MQAASAYLSEDDGQTWKGGLLLDERSSVSYPDGFESPDGLIHILYDWNRHTDAEILLAKFREEDVLAGNPVFKAETKHELAGSALGEGEKGQEAVTYLGHGGVFYDPAAKHFKMYYTAGWRGPLALATSPDLKNWSRPNLGIVEDNLLLAKGRDAGGDNSLWLDLASKDARLKLLTDRGKEGHFLQSSTDVRAWTVSAPTGKAGDYCSIFHNPFRDLWCYSIKQGGKHGRNRWYHESRDFMHGADWSKSVF